jgi:hypothetical protein
MQLLLDMCRCTRGIMLAAPACSVLLAAQLYLCLLMLVWVQAVHQPLVSRLDLLLAGTAWHSKYCIQLLVSICRDVSRAAASFKSPASAAAVHLGS